jgi:Peptidase_C39 like family
MSRARWIGLCSVLLLVALAAWVPRGGHDEGAFRQTGRTATGHTAAHPPAPPQLTAGYGQVAPAYRREIDAVIGPTTSTRLSARSAPRTLVDDLVRCAVFEGQRYCLGTGWTEQSQSEVQARTTALVTRQAGRTATGARTTTGDLSTLARLRQQAKLGPAALAAAQRDELTQAARSVAKVWLLRHQVQGVALPPHFFANHPEVRVQKTPGGSSGRGVSRAAPTSAPVAARKIKPWRAYPDKGAVLDGKDVAAQHQTYWCGPTSMQMITWGWSGHRRSQRHWAARLGTTTSGTSITSMVSVVNDATGWDKASYAGPYVVLDIADWSFHSWMLLMARHIVDYRAPVVLHPVLLTQFYPYLDHDGSGHFQVGRGYRKRGDKTPLLGYFEPWNQQRFHPDEPYIPRVQWRNAYKSYRANEAHFQHDLGV